MRLIALTLAILLVFTLVAAEQYPFDASLYDAEDVTVLIEVSSSVSLSGSGSAKELSATVHYVPEEASEIIATPKPTSTNPLIFTWRDAPSGTYPFSYTTEVESSIKEVRITNTIPYPFTSPSEVTQYLQRQEITDTNAAIRAQASRLSAGEDDALAVVFALASWVHDNVEYDLSTVTAEASQKSSWVLENRRGVCDEITSLFISLSREAGIPARFVSGLSYTNLPEFEDNFGPHGWAEVWLPGYGWIPVDVTYGQIGYVDATHIAVRKGLDAKNTAIDYSLLANTLSMSTTPLQTNTEVVHKSGTASKRLTTELEPLYKNAGSQSGNLITAEVTNQENHYVATELYLYGTQDTTIHEQSRQQILLPPKSSRTVSWRVTMPAYQQGYEYTVPFAVLNQRAGNATTNVYGSTRTSTYPLPPKTEIVSSIPVSCEQPETLYIGETQTVTCQSQGSTLCSDSCSQSTHDVTFSATQAGAFPVLVSATQDNERGSSVVTFLVENRPRPSISITAPKDAIIGSTLQVQASVTTEKITDVTVSISGKRFTQEWVSEELLEQRYELSLYADYLDAGDNTITVTVKGKDKNGAEIIQSADAIITLDATIWDRVYLFLTHLFL